MSFHLIRLPEVRKRSGLATSTVYLRVKQGLLTPPVSIGFNASAWPDQEIDQINAAWAAGASIDQIKDLVARLIEKRRAAFPVPA
jgi:prophage regulatory protein